MKKLVLFGIGDLAEIARFYFENDADYEVAAFTVDKEYKKTNTFLGLPVYDFASIEQKFPPDEYEMFIAMAYTHLNEIREDKFKEAKKKGYTLASYISSHMTCWIDKKDIGENCFILEDNTIQPFVRIGNNTMLWSGNHIGHHAEIGNNVFITSHVVLSWRTKVGDNSFIGVNATINYHVEIAPKCVIGSGALITKNTEEGCVYKSSYTEKYKKTSEEIRYFKG